MIITCGNCLAKFKVAPELIKESGSKVRCSNCQYVFTVYRPGNTGAHQSPPASSRAAATPPSPGRDPLAEFLNEPPPPEPDENQPDFGLPPAPRPAAGRRQARGLDLPDLDPLAYEEDEFGPASEKQPGRRQAARAATPREAAFDDDLDDLDFDEEETRPPLRRKAALKRRREARAEEADSPAIFDQDALKDEPGAAPRADRKAAPADSAGLDLGLSGGGPASLAETEGEAPEDAENDDEDQPAGGASNTRAPHIFLALAVLATFLAVGIFIMSNRPEPVALLAEGDPNQTPALGPAEPSFSGTAAGEDLSGVDGLTFPSNETPHFFRDNKSAGRILIITGRVRNEYPERRSFIRIKGLLESADGSILAERQVYAGNILTEEELAALPVGEILARLAIKGGQDGGNMNLEPGGDLPFMVVFDKLPAADMYSFRIEPIGSAASAP